MGGAAGIGVASMAAPIITLLVGALPERPAFLGPGFWNTRDGAGSFPASAAATGEVQGLQGSVLGFHRGLDSWPSETAQAAK